MKKIIITGVESSGKTTLAIELAEHLMQPLVQEISRSYLQSIGLSYEKSDILEIAKLQLNEEEKYSLLRPEYLICDTSLIVLKVWSLYKYGECHPWILEQIKKQNWNLFLLPHYNIPFERDELRENEKVRVDLFELYLEELKQLSVPFYLIDGDKQERLSKAIALIDLI